MKESPIYSNEINNNIQLNYDSTSQIYNVVKYELDLMGM